MQLPDASSSINPQANRPFREKPEVYGQWITYYLFSELRETSKIFLLDDNVNTKARFIPTDDKGTLSFMNTLADLFHDLEHTSPEPVELNLYINIHDDNTYDTFTLMNFMDIVKSIPNTNVRIVQIATTSHEPGSIVDAISDDTALYGISDLLAGTRAFLKYGNR